MQTFNGFFKTIELPLGQSSNVANIYIAYTLFLDGYAKIICIIRGNK